MFKKIIIGVIALAAVAAGLYWYFGLRSTQTAGAAVANLTTAPLQRGSLTETISATGKVRPSQTTNLNWQTTGIVEEVSVKLGDHVTAGQVLARLKQTSLPQSVIMAQADLISAQQALDDLTTQAETSKNTALENIMTYESSARDAQYQLDNFTIPSNQANLSTTEALDVMRKRLDEARKAFEPYKYYPSTNQTREDLKETLGQAQADYDAAIKRLKFETELELAQANLNQAWTDFKKWENGPDPQEVESATAKVAAAQATLSQAWVEAPFAGTITQVEPRVGDRAASSQLAFRLDDLSTQYIDLDVSEIDIHKVQIGQPAEISLDALPDKTYTGVVTEIAAVSTSSDGAVNFTVTVGMTNADADVRTGMTAEVKIAVGQAADVLLIPIQAMQVMDGKQVVYVLRPGATAMQPVPVELGISNEEYSALVSGELKEGDPIVLNPTATDTSSGGGRMMFGPGGPPGGGRSSGGGNRSTGGGGQP